MCPQWGRIYELMNKSLWKQATVEIKYTDMFALQTLFRNCLNLLMRGEKILGVIHLKDIIKQGVQEKFADLRKMGIKTIMITGDNPMTAAAIAAEAGVDDFIAEATPEGKLQMIRDFQSKGHLVEMMGDGTNDAPALAQADVAVAMNTGTQAAKEAGNMVDLDLSPT